MAYPFEQTLPSLNGYESSALDLLVDPVAAPAAGVASRPALGPADGVALGPVGAP